MPASQAGRRGFDPRLPLHVFNDLRAFEFLEFTRLDPPRRQFLVDAELKQPTQVRAVLRACAHG